MSGLTNAIKALNSGGALSLAEKRLIKAALTALYADITSNDTDIAANSTAIDTLNFSATETVTATVGGGTTGLISADSEYVTVTSDNADKQVSLPAAVAGKKMKITVPATGCELISAVAGDKINGVVVGATNEAALTAGYVYNLEYDGTDNWIMTSEATVVPDAL